MWRLATATDEVHEGRHAIMMLLLEEHNIRQQNRQWADKECLDGVVVVGAEEVGRCRWVAVCQGAGWVQRR